MSTTHPRIRVRIAITGILAAVLAAVSVGCAGTTPTPATHSITGMFELKGSHQGGYGSSPCEGIGGYTDIRAGARVTLRDAAGTVVATSSLEPGAPATGCLFAFTMSGVPEMPFYTVEVSHRGGITKSLADLKATGWTFALTLGQ